MNDFTSFDYFIYSPILFLACLFCPSFPFLIHSFFLRSFFSSSVSLLSLPIYNVYERFPTSALVVLMVVMASPSVESSETLGSVSKGVRGVDLQLVRV